MQHTWLHWSGGKDSAYAFLQHTQTQPFAGLVTTLNAEHKRVSMHGVRETVLESQASAIGLPLHKIFIPKDCSMQTYGDCMRNAMAQLKKKGATHCAFGDIYLEDLKTYRIQQMEACGLKPLFPIWKAADTLTLARQIIASGIKAIVVCINGKHLDSSFAGRPYDAGFVNDLPDGVDPCGENGEFHTFVYDAPYFKHAIPIKVGETVTKHYHPASNTDTSSACDTSPTWDTEFFFTDLTLDDSLTE